MNQQATCCLWDIGPFSATILSPAFLNPGVPPCEMPPFATERFADMEDAWPRPKQRLKALAYSRGLPDEHYDRNFRSA